MTANIGTIDRVLRALIGVFCFAIVLIGPFPQGGWENIVLAAVGVIMLFTSFIKFCPLYKLFGLRTCPAPKR